MFGGDCLETVLEDVGAADLSNCMSFKIFWTFKTPVLNTLRLS